MLTFKYSNVLAMTYRAQAGQVGEGHEAGDDEGRGAGKAGGLGDMPVHHQHAALELGPGRGHGGCGTERVEQACGWEGLELVVGYV